MAAADFQLDSDASGDILRLTGDWTVSGLPAAELRSRVVGKLKRPERVDVSQMGALDTAGALLLIQRWLGPPPWPTIEGLRTADLELLNLVGASYAAPRLRPRKAFGILPLLERTGAAAVFAWQQFLLLLAFGGQTLATIKAAWDGTPTEFGLERLDGQLELWLFCPSNSTNFLI